MIPSPKQIKEARQLAGITQTEAAELCFVTKSGFQHWEYGVRKMSLSVWELFQIKVKIIIEMGNGTHPMKSLDFKYLQMKCALMMGKSPAEMRVSDRKLP